MIRHAVHVCAVCNKYFVHSDTADFIHFHFRFCSVHCFVAFGTERRVGGDRRHGDRRHMV